MGKSPQGVAQKQGFWDKIRGKSEPSITSNKTKDEVLAKIDESLYEKYSRLKDFLHNRAGQIPELALDQQAITDFLAGLPSAIEADVNTDPQPYIDTIRDHATPHRQAPCTSLTMIDLTQSP